MLAVLNKRYEQIKSTVDEKLKKEMTFIDCLISRTQKLFYDNNTGKDIQSNYPYKVLSPYYFCPYKIWKFLILNDFM